MGLRRHPVPHSVNLFWQSVRLGSCADSFPVFSYMSEPVRFLKKENAAQVFACYNRTGSHTFAHVDVRFANARYISHFHRSNVCNLLRHMFALIDSTRNNMCDPFSHRFKHRLPASTSVNSPLPKDLPPRVRAIRNASSPNSGFPFPHFPFSVRPFHPLYRGGWKRTELSADSCTDVLDCICGTFRVRTDSRGKPYAETGGRNQNACNSLSIGNIVAITASRSVRSVRLCTRFPCSPRTLFIPRSPWPHIKSHAILFVDQRETRPVTRRLIGLVYPSTFCSSRHGVPAALIPTQLAIPYGDADHDAA